MSAATTDSSENLLPRSPAGNEGESVEALRRPDPDAELMTQAANGSNEAFAKILRNHQHALVNFFARMGATHDGEDLAQETFVRIYRYRKQYRPSARFSTFLYHLARHVWADRGRKILRMERLNAEYEQDLRVQENSAPEPAGRGVDVQAALDQLSPKLREVIVLNFYQGLRYQEVADVLEIPLGTVKSRINLAIAALKEILNER
jgi:RNA polymerase sigma-70 factor (ECF subfamily)